VASATGEVFDAAVNVTNVGDMHSYRLRLTYDTALLDAIAVAPGGFFPEQAVFEFTINEPAGWVAVNASLPSFATALWGDGALTCVRFRAVQPSPDNAEYSIIRLNQTEIYDTGLALIDHCSVSGIYFWQTIQPDPLQEERLVDLFTQKGGAGQDVSGGMFILNDLVHLTAYVTYNDWPQQNLLVTFQVIGPSGETVFLDIVETDEYGYATVSFRIPDLETSLGLWSVVASVDIACTIVWDSTELQVVPELVGGTSLAVETYGAPGNPALYVATVIVITMAFAGARRKLPAPFS
jgi:hypothetical protein